MMKIKIKEKYFALFSVLLFTLLLGFYYKTLGINILFLKAESGLYLGVAFDDIHAQWKFVKEFMLSSYNGHFTPLVLIFEFLQSKLYGSNESFWFWRQMLVCGLLATALSMLYAEVCHMSGLRRDVSWAIGASGAAIFVCQPMMIDMIVWPFMAIQLLMMSSMALSGYFLVRFIGSRESTCFNYFLVAAYLTMHFFGLGLSVSLSALATGVAVLILLHSTDQIESKKLKNNAFWIAVAFGLTAAHAVIMLLGAATPKPVGEPLTALENVYRFGWLLMDSCYAGLRAIWGNGGFQWPDTRAAEIEGVYGIGFLLLGLTVVVTLAIQYRKTKDYIWLIVFGLFSLSFLTLVINLFLIIFRLRFVQGAEAVIPYLIGSRYVIFPAFYIVMMGGGILILLARTFGSLIAYPAMLAATSSIIGTYSFALTLMPTIWPYTQVNSTLVWHNVVDIAKRDLKNGRPLHNVDLTSLDPEFKFDLKGRRHLLEHELNCTGCVHFDDE